MRNRKTVAAIFALGLFPMGVCAAAAQESILYSFGSSPTSELVQDANGNLFGMTSKGGRGTGTVFELSPVSGGGWTEKTLYYFGSNGVSDGAEPYTYSGLIVDAQGNLYGTTEFGGTDGEGTVFEVSPKTGGTWQEKILYSFGAGDSDADGHPEGGVIRDASGNLYGTLANGGTQGQGAVFELSPGTGGSWTETILYSFSGTVTNGGGPAYSLISDASGNLYGTLTSNAGAIFRLAPEAGGTWSYTVLYRFSSVYTGGPAGHLTFDASGNLYGTTGTGVVYELMPAAQGLWTETTVAQFLYGDDLTGGVSLDATGSFYLTDPKSADAELGQVLKFSLVVGPTYTSTVLDTLHAFTGLNRLTPDGSEPEGGLIFDSQGNIFGTTFSGGTSNAGTVFEIARGATVVASPVFSPGSGQLRGAQMVSITDATPNTTIHYTIDAGAPTIDSPIYTEPLEVSQAEDIQAIAFNAAGGASAVVLASYDVLAPTPPPPPPVIYPPSGNYSTPQTLVMTDTGSEALIYYTTDGSDPTSSSTPYTGPVSLAKTETVKAIAYGIGSNSTVATASYNVSLTTTSVNVPLNAFGAGNLLLNGATIVSHQLQLTDGGSSEARSAWLNTKVYVAGFTTDFEFQLLNAQADGFTFTLQNQGPNAVGYNGGGLGYQGIADSVAVKFDLYDNGGEGSDTTGVYTGGVPPTTPATNLAPSLIDLHSGDIMHAHITYSGTTLTLTLTDTKTNATMTQAYTVNIPEAVGGSSAYAGFTGGTGGETATQNILSWSFTPQNEPAAPLPSPLILPASGDYSAPPTVTMQDAMAGVSIYYTLDGSTPTTSSTLYTAPFTAAANNVITAIAVLANHTNSSPATVSYSDGKPTVLDFPAGAFTSTGLTLNGATISGNSLQLTDGGPNEARSAWSTGKVSISTFRTNFEFQILDPGADGFTFAIQNVSPAAVGAPGGGLGYQGIGNSVAVKFDLYNNGGEGVNSTGTYIDGAPPTLPADDLTPTGLDLHSGDVIDADLEYDGNDLLVTLLDATTGAMATFSYPIDIAGEVGSNKAYVGFTGGTGGASAIQNILSWTYTPSVNMYIPFEVPGATTEDLSCFDLCGTTPVGINRHGTVAGWYSDASGVSHGFVRDHLGNITTFDYPGVTPDAGPFAGTQVVAINNEGTILGTFEGSGQFHSFLRDREGTITTIDFNSSSFSAGGSEDYGPCAGVPTGINDEGTVIGTCGNEGYARNADGTVTTFSQGFTADTVPSGINDAGTIAGTDIYYQQDELVALGFLLPPGGSISDFSNGGVFTSGKAINQSGVIAGYIETPYSNTPHQGFVRAVDGTLTIFTTPESDVISIAGINATGEVAGTYHNAHGFIRSASGDITTFDAPNGTAATNGFANGTHINAINDWGVVTGTYNDSNGVQHGFILKPTPPAN